MAKKGKQKPAADTAPQFFKVTDETRRWAALIASDVMTWPRVTTRKMFGLKSFYRGAAIFGAVPESRALFSANAIIFKLVRVTPSLHARVKADPKVSISGGPGQKWFAFQLAGPEDIHAALAWLGEAYERVK